MGEGQLEVPDATLTELNELDSAVAEAVDSGDSAVFARELSRLLDRVRAVGSPVPAETLLPSELILPAADSTLEEVRSILGEEGLIPG
jgi:hypothetical protein